jgi:hypothetical protein
MRFKQVSQSLPNNVQMSNLIRLIPTARPDTSAAARSALKLLIRAFQTLADQTPFAPDKVWRDTRALARQVTWGIPKSTAFR